MKLHIKEQSLVFFKSMNSSSLKCVFICIRVSLPFCLCVYHEILQRPDNGLESLLTELTVSFFFFVCADTGNQTWVPYQSSKSTNY